MNNYQSMSMIQLLEEKSHLEQIGTPAITQLLEVQEELTARKALQSTVAKPKETKVEIAANTKPIEISYTRNAQAVIYPTHIEFYANERGTKRISLQISELEQLNTFYVSQYLANGIKKRVIAYLEK
jgi:hypothetical protein